MSGAQVGEKLRLDDTQSIGTHLTRWAWAVKLLLRKPVAVWNLAMDLPEVDAAGFLDPGRARLTAPQLYALVNGIIDELEKLWRGGDATKHEWIDLNARINDLPNLVPERAELIQRLDASADGIHFNRDAKMLLADALQELQSFSNDITAKKEPTSVMLFTGTSSTGKSYLSQSWLSVLDSPCFEKQVLHPASREIDKINPKSLDGLEGSGIPDCGSRGRR